MEDTEVISGWYLKRIPVEGPGDTFIVLKENEVTIGRTVCLSPHVSRKHVQFQKTFDNNIFIKDLKSVNGTYINSRKIDPEILNPVKVGDRIILGKDCVKSDDDFEFELCFANEPTTFRVIKNPKVKGLYWLTYSKDNPDEADNISGSASVSGVTNSTSSVNSRSRRKRSNRSSSIKQKVCNTTANTPSFSSVHEDKFTFSKSEVDNPNNTSSSNVSSVTKETCGGAVNNSSDFDVQIAEEASDEVEIVYVNGINNSPFHKSADDTGDSESETKKCRTSSRLREDKQKNVETLQRREAESQNSFRQKKQSRKASLLNPSFLKPCFVVLERCDHLVKKHEKKIEEFGNEMKCTDSLSDKQENADRSDDDTRLLPVHYFRKGRRKRRKIKNPLIITSDDESTNQFKKEIKTTLHKLSSSGESDNESLSVVALGSDSKLHCLPKDKELEKSVETVDLMAENSKPETSISQMAADNVTSNTEIPAYEQTPSLNMVQEEFDDDKCSFTYSQIDEVITISSDDDDDVGFPPSKCGEELLEIKLEPLSDEEEYCEEQVDASVNCYNALDSLVPDDELKKHLKWPGESPTVEENDYSDFFPILSQSFNDTEEEVVGNQNDHDIKQDTLPDIIEVPERECDSQIVTRQKDLDHLIQKNRQRKVSKATYTDALPQVNKRRSHFDDQNEKRKVKQFYGKPAANADGWTSKKKQKFKIPITDKRKAKKKQSIKQKIKQKFSHRIPIPGGGSAIRSGSEPDSSARILRTSERSNSKLNKRKDANHQSETIKTVNQRPKRAPKLTTEQRFASRQSSLIEELTKEKKDLSKPIGKPSKIAQNQSGNESVSIVDGQQNSNAELTTTSKVVLMPAIKITHDTHRPTDVNKCVSDKPLKGILKPKVRFSENVSVMDVPKALDDKGTAKIISRDPRLLKQKRAPNNQKSANVTNTLPGPNFPKVKVINHVVSWKTIWLKEQCKMKDPPPVVALKTLKSVCLSYGSFDDYCNTYYNLLLLEMWQSVYKDWCEVADVKPFLRLCINDCHSVDDVWQIHCQAIVGEAKLENDTIFVEGHLITLYLIDAATKEKREVFGYVTEHKSEPLANCPSVPILLQSAVEKNKTGRIVSLVIVTSQRHFSVSAHSLVKGKMVSYIKPLIKQADAILTLSSSLLVRDILCPRKECFSVHHQCNATLHAIGAFNELQREAILGAADAILRPFAIPQIKLFQGPPGTGKTNVIVGLIQHLVHPSTPTQKVLLVCASNGAVDEIARRLMKIRTVLKEEDPLWKMRLVRVGQASQISVDVKPISAELLAFKNLAKQKNSLDHEMKKTCETIDSLHKKIEVAKLKGCNFKELNKMEEKMANLCKTRRLLDIHSSREQSKPVSQKSDSFKKTLREILQNANVILSTLNSCRQTILESTFGRKDSTMFTCCIVDEATQCTEPELLTALQYGISKLILVGDPKQLPATVLSNKAANFKYSTSFFERMYKYFRERETKSPVLMLTQQYRMHSDICWFPSHHFYSSRLRTFIGVDQQMSDFPLRPYICINILDGKENTTSGTSFENPCEAELVVNLFQSLNSVLPLNTAVGIITPYQGQKQLFLQLLKSDAIGTGYPVEVNTVDGFQGREKDVIILSCVRSGKTIGFLEHSQRLNVAITRARKCLIICGHLQSLREHAHWQELIDDAKKRNLVINVTPADAISNIVKKLRKNTCVQPEMELK